MATGPQLTPRRPSDRQQFPHTPPLHLIACPAILVIGALVILAIHWLR
jgi:hypothetical protein